MNKSRLNECKTLSGDNLTALLWEATGKKYAYQLIPGAIEQLLLTCLYLLIIMMCISFLLKLIAPQHTFLTIMPYVKQIYLYNHGNSNDIVWQEKIR